ncbi:hypothetical protein DPMN_053919 [Dreissena polymorpha]|uniref:Uncharacterized protein n=1 Tax=Dreissena polymorpha TaxID=45954 RepID=A0A9D4CPC2_DREPO|nr:hypothetical protein DPMN_053919 [Dreissena polymorpha]
MRTTALCTLLLVFTFTLVLSPTAVKAAVVEKDEGAPCNCKGRKTAGSDTNNADANGVRLNGRLFR